MGGRRLRLTTLPPSVADCLENVGASTSHSPMGRNGMLTGIALPSRFITQVVSVLTLKYSKSLTIWLQLIRMSDNLDLNMQNWKCCSRLGT
jgi:hypothetical protein